MLGTRRILIEKRQRETKRRSNDRVYRAHFVRVVGIINQAGAARSRILRALSQLRPISANGMLTFLRGCCRQLTPLLLLPLRYPPHYPMHFPKSTPLPRPHAPHAPSSPPAIGYTYH